MNWLKKYYPVDSEILVPHLRSGDLQTVTVVNHATDRINKPGREAAGIIVQFDDRTFCEIEQGLLNETGGGFVD